MPPKADRTCCARLGDLKRFLIETPFVAGTRATAGQCIRLGRPELEAPAPDRFLGEHDAPHRPDLFDLSKAER